MNKIMLQKQIMAGVKKSLMESFIFEQDPVGEDILKIISKNENIAKTVKMADESDWTDLINKIKELAVNGHSADMKMPVKITNLNNLAKAFFVKMDVNNINLIKKMSDDEIADLVEYLNGESDNADSMPAIESKKNEGECHCKDCKDGECQGGACKSEEKDQQMTAEKQAIKESRLAKRHHAKTLNESANLNVEIRKHLASAKSLAKQSGNSKLSLILSEIDHMI